MVRLWLSLCLSSQCLSAPAVTSSRDLCRQRGRGGGGGGGGGGEMDLWFCPMMLWGALTARQWAGSAALVTLHQTVTMTAHILLLLALCFSRASSQGTTSEPLSPRTHHTRTHTQRRQCFSVEKHFYELQWPLIIWSSSRHIRTTLEFWLLIRQRSVAFSNSALCDLVSASLIGVKKKIIIV